MTSTYKHTELALIALKLFPPSIRASLISEPTFQKKYEIKTDVQVSFGDKGLSINQSELFRAIREILGNSSTGLSVKDTIGEEWRLELVEQDNLSLISISHGENSFFLPDFYPLSPNQRVRLDGFEREADEVNLPGHTVSKWRDILSLHALTEDEFDTFHKEINETPIRVSGVITSDIKKGSSTLSSLIPRSKRYFERLVGKCQHFKNIEEYAPAVAKEHISQLMSWRAYDGFLLALLLSSHAFNSSEINCDELKEEEFIQAYKWLLKKGDRISQIGAIEIGLAILDRIPKIEPHLKDIIEQIIADNTDEERSQFALLSSLIVLVDGELSRRKFLAEKPPFWRRLASIAQASIIERCIIGSDIDTADFSNWALHSGGSFFYLQNTSDLRLEPRWQPDYISAKQLKAELISRIVNAAQKNDSKIKAPALRELLLGEGPGNLRDLIKFPYLFLPGPLEGGLESQLDATTEIVEEIEAQLTTEVLQPNSFALLVNSSLIFRLDTHQGQLAAKALRTVKYQIKKADNKEQLFSVLSGLATVAAVTRCVELAEELRILIRRCRHEQGQNLSAEEAMRIGLIAAASNSGLKEWCDFVGEWITELSFQEIRLDEMMRMHSHIEHLCHIVPELWATCGRAEAALSAVVNSNPNLSI